MINSKPALRVYAYVVIKVCEIFNKTNRSLKNSSGDELLAELVVD